MSGSTGGPIGEKSPCGSGRSRSRSSARRSSSRSTRPLGVPRVRAQGTDAKGRGGAVAIVDFQLQPAPEGTSVLVNTDINLTGSVAQYGRASGIIQGVANQLMAQFADNLRKSFAPQQGRPAGQDSTPQPNAVPISGFSLIVRALWTAIKRLFTREGPDGPKAR